MISVGSVVLDCLDKGDLEVLCYHHLKTLKFFKVPKLSSWYLKCLKPSSFCKNVGFGFTKWHCWCQSGCSKVRVSSRKESLQTWLYIFLLHLVWGNISDYCQWGKCILHKVHVESSSEAEEEALPEPGVMGKLVLTFCSHTIKPLQGSSSQWEQLSLLRGRWGGEQTVLLLLCFWTPEKCSMTIIIWSGQFQHLFQITEMELKSLEYSSLFRLDELRNSSQRDTPSTSWVCMGLSCAPNPF